MVRDFEGFHLRHGGSNDFESFIKACQASIRVTLQASLRQPDTKYELHLMRLLKAMLHWFWVLSWTIATRSNAPMRSDGVECGLVFLEQRQHICRNLSKIMRTF